MIQPCPRHINCPGQDYPIENLSSEEAESAYWRAIGWCCNGAIKDYLSYSGREDAQLGLQRTLVEECAGCPPDPESQYSATAYCADGTAFTVYSSVSQEDADTRAQEAADAAQCPPADDGGTPSDGGKDGGTAPVDGDSGVTVYYNTQQVCQMSCPGGSIFAYTIGQGLIAGYSQAEANAVAYAWACAGANAYKFCLGDLGVDECCVGAALSQTIVASPSKRLNWQLLSGALPPGVTFTEGWNNTGRITLEGTPSTAGNYTFTILATDAHGAYMSRAYALCVVDMAVAPAGATLTEFPDATENDQYTATLSATACATTPLSWQITAGALPAGLSLNEGTGVVTGTPTESGDFTFTVTLQTEAT